MINTFAFLLVLGVLVAVHELGHFLVAKYFGVGVIKFSIGFGPVLCRFRRAETQYQISAIPLGGFVRMVGDIPDAVISNTSDSVEEILEKEETWPELDAAKADRSKWFLEKPLWVKAAVVAAGPAFNFIFAFFVYLALVGFYGVSEPESKPLIGNLSEGGAAEAAGFKKGDIVLSINSEKVESWVTMSELIRGAEKIPLNVELKRDSEIVFLEVTPRETELSDGSKVQLIGVERPVYTKDLGLFGSVKEAGWRTGFMTYKIVEGVWGLIAGDVSFKELGGPIAIYNHTADSVKSVGTDGFRQLLTFIGFLSVSLAVLNLLPIPVLDGGHLMMYFFEFVLGPISFKKKMVFQQVGFVLLLLLMVFAFTNDIRRLFDDTEVTSEAR